MTLVTLRRCTVTWPVEQVAILLNAPMTSSGNTPERHSGGTWVQTISTEGLCDISERGWGSYLKQNSTPPSKSLLTYLWSFSDLFIHCITSWIERTWPNQLLHNCRVQRSDMLHKVINVTQGILSSAKMLPQNMPLPSNPLAYHSVIHEVHICKAVVNNPRIISHFTMRIFIFLDQW